MGEKSYYDILGLEPSASLEDVKKKYREMARKYHPDVAKDKQMAAQIFAKVNEAYRTLSDPEARKTYDAEMSLRARTREAAAARAAASAPRPNPPPSDNRVANQQESERRVGQARTAFGLTKMAEARSLAEQALRLYPRNAGAYEVLGDICRVQGRNDDAITHYTMVLQLDPRNAAARQRLERLVRTSPVRERAVPRPTAAPSDSRPGPPSGPPRTHVPPRMPLEDDRYDKRSLIRSLLGFLGYAGTILVLLFSALFLDHSRPAHALPLPFVAHWSWALVGLMGLAGLLLGSTLATTGAIRRIEDEMLLAGGGKGVPLGLFVLVISAVNFYLAAGLHLFISWSQETFTASLARLYGAVALVTLLAALPCQAGFVQTLTFGGNVIFLACMVGWFLGDFFRID